MYERRCSANKANRVKQKQLATWNHREFDTGKDGVIWAVGLRTRSGRDELECAMQQLYPLELSCDNFKNVDREHTSYIKFP